MDTIFSSATGHLKSAIKIIRISGKRSNDLPGILSYKVTKPRIASLRKLYDLNKKLIDNAIVIYFPGPNTVTGEDLYEIHIHGSLIIEKKIYQVLGSQENFRIAEPGEFTKRALLSGNIDLTQAEGLNDLINSETEGQLNLSLSQYEGGLSKTINLWRKEIINLLSKLEAMIDFSDEELPHYLESDFNNKVLSLLNEMKKALKASNFGERLRNGFVVTILGRPNVGKSSLINCLSNRNVAIVTNESGTTRDILEVLLDFNGFPVLLNDTAGIRESESKVEKIGIKKALKKAKNSDVILLLSDKDDFHITNSKKFKKIIYVHTKVDLNKKKINDALSISVKTGKGIDELVKTIFQYFETLSPNENSYLTRERHILGVKKAVLSLQRLVKVKINESPELAAEDLRIAATSIGSITNIIDVEEILDDIFNSFCIGK